MTLCVDVAMLGVVLTGVMVTGVALDGVVLARAELVSVSGDKKFTAILLAAVAASSGAGSLARYTWSRMMLCDQDVREQMKRTKPICLGTGG